MRVRAAFLAVGLIATVGLVVAQERPARNAAVRSPGGGQPTAPQGKESRFVRAITDLLGSFIKAYNAKDAKALGALSTSNAEIQDEDGERHAGRRGHRRPLRGDFQGERRHQSRRR